MLALAVCVFLSWVMGAIYWAYPRKLSRHESAMLFLVLLIVNISVSWIVDMELKDISLSPRVPEYLAYLLHRSLLIPLLPVMMINRMMFARTPFGKGLLLVVYGLVYFCMEKICLALLVFKFEKWNMGASMLVYYLYLLLAVALLKGYRKLFAREVKAS